MATPRAIAGYAVKMPSSRSYASRVKRIMDRKEEK